MMPPFVVFPTNRIAHFVEVSLYLFYLAQRVNFNKCCFFLYFMIMIKLAIMALIEENVAYSLNEKGFH